MVTNFAFATTSIGLMLMLSTICAEPDTVETTDLPSPIMASNIYYISRLDQEARMALKNISAIDEAPRLKNRGKNATTFREALRAASIQGFDAMIDLYERKEPEILRKGEYLDRDHPAVQLSLFSAAMTNESDAEVKAAYANLFAAKKLQESYHFDFTGHGRQASKKRISLKRTTLESLCPPREAPECLPATRRYRTHDGTCNNVRRPRWGSAQLPFHRFLAPEYADGLETVRGSVTGGQLPSSRFVSLVVHGFREDEAPITMLLPQWGQLIDHDVTATLQPRSINGSIPSCCRSQDPHPSCLPIKVPADDPFLGTLGVRCLEFLRSAPASRRDCFLSWREQTNQVTSFIDASPVYSSNPRTADSSRIQRDGLLLFGRGPPREDACLRGGFGHQCIRAGDTRAGEQPGLLAMHTVFVAEHNRITLELSDLNPHWSDEKLYQETRRIIGAIFQHITYREFLPLVLGKEVCRLFDLELEPSGYYTKYDPKVNPTIANAFSAAAFRFGHALVQGSIMRSDTSNRFLSNNVSLHEENSFGDIGGIGSLHRIIRGLASQRTLKRDEFMSPELTNHLFQSNSFPFGMDLAAINIQRGRDHGLPAYVDWRQPCGLSAIRNWDDLKVVAGPKSAERMRKAYGNVEDIDLFVGGISERPVVGGLVGPTFACIIAQQFSNLRRGDRFWYENSGFESSFTPAQLFSIRGVTLSQILCRSLGSSNTLQPHAFLPPEFIGNERQRCGSGSLAPIDLSPWVERDPFHKEGDFPSSNFVEASFNEQVPVTSQKPVANVDFDSESPVLITARPRPSTTTDQTNQIDNKLEFSSTTTKRPKKKRTTTRKTSATVINNKIDFEDATRPNTPFSKLSKDVLTTKVKRSTSRNTKLPSISPEPRELFKNMTDDKTTRKIFLNQDNATKYMNNKPIAPRLDDVWTLESRHPQNRYGNENNDDDEYYYDRPYRPTYDYTYPPLTKPTANKRPTAFQNNRPSYQNPNYVDYQQTNSPISNKFASTPFSYDTYSTSGGAPSHSIENMVVPLYVSPNRGRPPTRTTRRTDFSTFLIVETTNKRPTPIYTTKRPSYQVSFSSQSLPFIFMNNQNNFHSSIDAEPDDDSTNVSYLSSSSNNVPIKHSSHANPFSSDSNPLSAFSSNSAGVSQTHDDQYLPFTSYYVPLKTQQPHKTSYNDYSNYNQKPSKMKFYYIQNVLHKYVAKSDDDQEHDQGLYKQTPSKRYAEFYDDRLEEKTAIDDKIDNISTEDEKKKDNDEQLTRTRTNDARSQKGQIFLVPFKLLTRVERPDNWVNTLTTDLNGKRRLPDVPQLLQDDSKVAQELPKPIFGRFWNRT